MRLRRRHLLAAAALGSIAVALPAIASSEALPVEAVDEGIYYHHWANAQQTIVPGEKVKFSNPYSALPYHGLRFTGPQPSSCTGIPAAAGTEKGAPNWQGECTFSAPGTYTFICTVHPTEMKGTITVKNVGEPAATTGAATSVTEHEATLKGTVNPEGKATEYFFKWGNTASYGQETSAQPAGEGTTNVPASAVLKGLAPGTPYHFQLVAKNSSGTVSGADQTFTTTSPPPPPGPPISPPPSNPPPPTATPSSTVTPSSTTPAPTIAAIEPLSGSPLVGGPSLRSSQHGASVHGTVEVSQAGAGGRLEVDLLANSASLAKAKHSVKVRVGRLSRSSLKAGAVSFAVPLTAKAKSALHRHRRLALTVQIVLTPLHGTVVTVTKSVLLHG